MRSKDITLTSNVIGLYVAITVLNATTPLKISAILYSALFGLFWNYFSLKRNIAIQTGRIAWNLIRAFRGIPQLVAMMKTQSIAGLWFLDWMNTILGLNVYNEGYQLLEITGQARPTFLFSFMYAVYVSLLCLILPYCFYRYFRYKGIFKRLPSL